MVAPEINLQKPLREIKVHFLLCARSFNQKVINKKTETNQQKKSTEKSEIEIKSERLVEIESINLI